MDRRERVYDPEEMLRSFVEAMLSRVWTALPGRISSFNPSKQTVEVQPAFNGQVMQTDGSFAALEMPLLVDIPVVFPGGGGATWTFPIKAGDECLVVFAARCIDNWYAQGYQPRTGPDANPANTPPDVRTHDLSDGFAIVGIRNQSRSFSSFDNSTARLRTDDDSCFIEFDPVNKKVNITASGGINFNGATIDSSGNVVSPGTVTGTTQVVAGSGGTAVHLTTHTHPGNGQPPTPGS